MIDKEKLIDNPKEWGANRTQTSEMQQEDQRELYRRKLMDLHEDHIRRIEDIVYSCQSDLGKAYCFLVDQGVIKKGDPAPWEQVAETFKPQ